MSTIKMVILEHDPNDLELLQYELKKAGLVYEARIVENRHDFVNALKESTPELILSDYSLPSFDGLSAFRLKQEMVPETPFIFVSGTIGEENAVELIKSGVTDYVLKEKMYQLVPKILRALKECEERAERKRNEREVAEHVQHIEDILETITDGFCSLDKNWIIRDWNYAAEQMMGVKREYVIGKHIWNDFQGDQFSKFYTEFHRVMEQRIPSAFSEYSRTTFRWYELNINPSKEGISVFFRDVGETRRQNELNLLEKQVLELKGNKHTTIEGLITFFMQGIQKIHPELTCMFVSAKNDGLFKLQLSQPEKFPGNSIERFTIDTVNAHLRGNGCFTDKIMIEHLSKEVLWKGSNEARAMDELKSGTYYPVINPGDDCLGILAVYSRVPGALKPYEEQTLEKSIIILKQIIEDKMSEIAFRNSEEIRRLIMDSSLDAIICMDASGAVTLWNPQAEEIFGWKEKDMIGEKLVNRIIPDQYLQQYHNAINSYLQTGYSFMFNRLVEASARRRDGKEFPIELTIIPIKQADNLTICIFIRDISERKENEIALKLLNEQIKQRAEELAVSNSELEQFAFIASHDLQEPLRMISSFLAMLEMKYKDQLDETGKQYIHFAVDGAVRSRKLIQDLLQFSRVGRKEVPFEQVDMNKMLDEVIQLNQTVIQEKKAVIERDELPVIYGSPVLLQQVLQNLILNALKYQKEGTIPAIKVKAQETDKSWQFSVEDNGIGIDPKFFGKIFLLFQRLHNKDEYTGTGIGLSICKKIVEGHKGKIWVESAPAKGSAFFFTIAKNNIAA